jgi:hypothetical protein
MAFITFNSAGLKKPIRLFLAFIAISNFSFLVLGQTAKPNRVQKTLPQTSITKVEPPATRANVDETFELNIDERHYSQESFEAATAVETKDGPDRLNLQIGVALASGRIDVLLRNVHGRVRFRGTLDRIFEVINGRQGVSPAAPVGVPVPSP